MNHTINVMEVDHTVVDPVEHRKAILAMQATALYVLGDVQFEPVNEQLIDLAGKIGKPATMTYEDLVFNNPTNYGDSPTRVISTDPAVASSEADFYRYHRSVEGYLHKAIDGLMFMDGHQAYYGAGDQVGTGFFTGGQQHPNEFTAVNELEFAVISLRNMYDQLDPGNFAAFRPYFVGLNGYPGPSGMYSAAIPILDMLVQSGRNISDEERQTMLTNLNDGLYPSGTKELVDKVHGNTRLYGSQELADLLSDENPQLDMPDTNRQGLVDMLNRFRYMHRGAVKKFVPGAMSGESAGSGGVANVNEYLGSKISRKKELERRES